MEVTGTRANFEVVGRHSLKVVVENVWTGSNDDLQSAMTTTPNARWRTTQTTDSVEYASVRLLINEMTGVPMVVVALRRYGSSGGMKPNRSAMNSHHAMTGTSPSARVAIGRGRRRSKSQRARPPRTAPAFSFVSMAKPTVSAANPQ